MNDSNHVSRKLSQQIEKWTNGENRYETDIPGLKLSYWDNPTPPKSYTHKPSICLIAQGQKQVLLGDDRYTYDSNHFLISSVNLPVIANITKASRTEPYLGIILDIDLHEVAQLIVDGECQFEQDKDTKKGLAVGSLSTSLLDAFVRLLSLLEEPDSIHILAPVIKREIFYRLLVSDQGLLLSQIVTKGSHSYQISKAIYWLKNHFIQPLSVNDLAAYSGMSKSSFYTHFRSITSMTPLQFQKQLRLSEARRLMLTENLDAMSTTYKVGYESPSQFSREYSRLFGAPPMTDIKALRETHRM